jgi:hypothetical protein
VDEFNYAIQPVLLLFAALGLLFLVWRFLFSRKCWRCGAGFDRFARSTRLFGIIPRTHCRRCGAKSINLF